MRLLPGFVAVGVLAGCSALTSLDGFSSGAPPSGAEGGASTTTSSSASSSTSSTSSSSSSSSSSSGGPPPDAGGCAFCTSFDNATLAQLATRVNVTDFGKLELDSSRLRARMPELPAAGQVYALMERDVSTTARRVSLELDMLIEEDVPWGTNDGNVHLLSVGVEGPKSGGFGLYLGNTYTSITTAIPGASALFDATTKNIPRDVWVRVRLVADLSPGVGSYKLYYGSDLVAERAGIPFPEFIAATTRVTIGLARYNAPTPALDVSYDNVAVTLP